MFKRGSISCRAAVSPSFNGKMSSAFNGHYLNQRFHVLCKYLGLRGHVCKALFLPESLRHQCYGDPLFLSHSSASLKKHLQAQETGGLGAISTVGM